MSKKLILFFAIAAVAFQACTKKDAFVKSEDGKYEYLLVPGGKGGPVPQEGDMAVFDFRMLRGSKELTSSYKTKLPAEVILMPLADANIFYKPLYKLAAGDSMVLRMVVDTSNMKLLGQPFVPGDTFYLNFYMREIKPKAEADAIKAKEEAKRAQFQEVRNAVTADTSAVMARAKKLDKELTARITDYKAGKLDAQIKTTPSGLKYIVHEEGTGPLANVGDPAFVYYIGMLTSDGTKFDSGFDRGLPFDFPVGKGRAIQGWDEALKILKEGTKATLFVPAALGYGDRANGEIPANAELAFYIEVKKVIQ